MKKIFIFIILFSIFNNSFGEEFNCRYSGKIEKCLNNQDNYREITDFTCIQSGIGEIVFQIILDERFKEIDEKIENYLMGLEKSKGYYFGSTKQEFFTNGIDDIEYFLGEGGEFAKLYKKLCDGEILEEAMDCLGGKSSNLLASNFVRNNFGGNLCYLTYKTSLENYKETAYVLFKENKKDVMFNDFGKFNREQRSKFDDLFDLIMINLGYLERLGFKWQTKTKKTMN